MARCHFGRELGLSLCAEDTNLRCHSIKRHERRLLRWCARHAGGGALLPWYRKSLTEVCRYGLGLDDDNGGTVGSKGCGELLGELLGGVCMHCVASESSCDGNNIEAW